VNLACGALQHNFKGRYWSNCVIWDTQEAAYERRVITRRPALRSLDDSGAAQPRVGAVALTFAEMNW